MSKWKSPASFTTIGLDLVLSILVGWFGGRWLDGKLDTSPWIEIVGFLIGVAAGFRSLHRGYTEMKAITKAEEKAEGNPRQVWGEKAGDAEQHAPPNGADEARDKADGEAENEARDEQN